MFHEAAARYFIARPWHKFADDDVLKIEFSLAAGSPWFALVLGRSGVTLGLAVYRELNTIREMFARRSGHNNETAARQMDGFSVQFSEEFELAPRDADAIEQFGWPVAQPEAFPLLMVIKPGAQLQPPTPDELKIVTACLDGVAALAAQPHPPQTRHAGSLVTLTCLGGIDTVRGDGR